MRRGRVRWYIAAAAFLVLVLGIFASIRSSTWPVTAPRRTPAAGTPAEVQIRIRNATNVDFGDVGVRFYGDEVDFGRVAPGGTSGYLHPPHTAFRRAYVTVHSSRGTLAYTPSGQVGDQPLAPGHYTYVLTLGGDGRLQLSLLVDP